MKFTTLFEEALRKKALLDKSKRSTAHNHPSEVMGCERAFWYKVNQVPVTNPPSTSLIMIWEQGHALQGIMESVLPLIPDIEEYEIEKEVGDDQYNIGGHADLLVRIKEKWYLIDFKTTGMTKFKEVKKGKVPEEYKGQMHLYMHCLKKKSPLKYAQLDGAYLFFINKSPIPSETLEGQGKGHLAQSPFHEVFIPFDRDFLETVVLPQVEYLEDIRKMDTPPEGTEDSKKCTFCEYRDLCKK